MDQKHRKDRLNKTDNEYSSILLSLEHKCCKLRAGAVEFLPVLSKAGLTWRF